MFVSTDRCKRFQNCIDLAVGSRLLSQLGSQRTHPVGLSERIFMSKLSRRGFVTTLAGAPYVLRAQQPGTLRARFKIDTERVIGDIDPKIYGNFVEHLGRCIDGGIFEEKSPLSDENGFRKDVMDAVKKLNVTQLRWPGGNFSSNYMWKD